jgi:hypothetical protein
MTRPALVWCMVLATVLTALTTFTLAWGAVFRCSGDTDGCDPSWVNAFLFGFALLVGGALTVGIPLRLRRLAAAGPVSWGIALVHVIAGTLALLLLYSLLDAVLPEAEI